jgi:hypothetical protein
MFYCAYSRYIQYFESEGVVEIIGIEKRNKVQYGWRMTKSCK